MPNLQDTLSVLTIALQQARLIAGSGYTPVTVAASDVGPGALSLTVATLNATGSISWSGRAQITSPADSQILLQNNAGTSFGLLQFGGTTSSFPAWKRNGATVEARLADDSGQAAITVSYVTAVAGGGNSAVQLGRLTTNQIELQADNNRFNLTNTAGTVGALLDTATDGILKVLTRGAAATTTLQAGFFQTMTALVALGGGAAPTLGTIGGSGPATAAQNTWLQMKDSTGANFWVPAWK